MAGVGGERRYQVMITLSNVRKESVVLYAVYHNSETWMQFLLIAMQKYAAYHVRLLYRATGSSAKGIEGIYGFEV